MTTLGECRPFDGVSVARRRVAALEQILGRPVVAGRSPLRRLVLLLRLQARPLNPRRFSPADAKIRNGVESRQKSQRWERP